MERSCSYNKSRKKGKVSRYKKTGSLKLEKRPVLVARAKSLPVHAVNLSEDGDLSIESYLETLLWNKRGTRVCKNFSCLCCGKRFFEWWCYIAEGSRIYLCNKCKSKIKPQFTGILYTPMK